MKKIDELLTVLQDELLCYKALLDLKQKEHGLLVRGEASDLMQNTHNMELIIQQIRSLERNRVGIVEDIRKDFNPNESKACLSSLLTSLPERYRNQLEKVGGQLKDVLGTLKMWNDENHACLEQALNFITNTFRTLLKEATEQENYSPTGERHSSSRELVLAVDRTV